MYSGLQLEIQSTNPPPGLGMTCEILYKSGDIDVDALSVYISRQSSSPTPHIQDEYRYE